MNKSRIIFTLVALSALALQQNMHASEWTRDDYESQVFSVFTDHYNKFRVKKDEAPESVFNAYTHLLNAAGIEDKLQINEDTLPHMKTVWEYKNSKGQEGAESNLAWLSGYEELLATSLDHE